MKNKQSDKKYRLVGDLSEEGFEFSIALRYIEYVYKKVLKCRPRKDGPNTIMHYSRDWEYPWILLRSEIKQKDKVLDCGSGYSPLPFIWSKLGAEVHAIDKDIMLCSRSYYAFFWAKKILIDLLRSPLFLFSKYFNYRDQHKISACILQEVKEANKSQYIANTANTANTVNTVNAFAKTVNYVCDYLANLGVHFKRALRPDCWGPVSPSLLKKYKIAYENGKDGDLTNLSYPNQSFDVVACVSVLEHMPLEAQLKGLREMSRVVKKGGKLIITYDLHEDLTDRFIKESGLKPVELVHVKKPENLYDKRHSDTIGMLLIK